jgi:hypothetical protein
MELTNADDPSGMWNDSQELAINLQYVTFNF